MADAVQFVTVLFCEESSNGSQLQVFEERRNTLQKNWGHFMNEHGMYWGREDVKGGRLWLFCFWKDEESQRILDNDPAFKEYQASFYTSMAPTLTKLSNVPVRGSSLPLQEILESGVVYLGYFRFSAGNYSAGFEEILRRTIKEFDYEGWRGGAYFLPTADGGEGLILGAWDSVDALGQVGADDRHSDLLAKTTRAYESMDSTFIALVKFQKHTSA